MQINDAKPANEIRFFRNLKLSNKYYNITTITIYSTCDILFDVNDCSWAVFVLTVTQFKYCKRSSFVLLNYEFYL